VSAMLLVRGLRSFLRRDLDALFAAIGSKSAVAVAQEEVENVERAFEAERLEHERLERERLEREKKS